MVEVELVAGPSKRTVVWMTTVGLRRCMAIRRRLRTRVRTMMVDRYRCTERLRCKMRGRVTMVAERRCMGCLRLTRVPEYAGLRPQAVNCGQGNCVQVR